MGFTGSGEAGTTMACHVDGGLIYGSPLGSGFKTLLEIWFHRTVRGISFIFLGIDAAGDVFSLVSVCD